MSCGKAPIEDNTAARRLDDLSHVPGVGDQDGRPSAIASSMASGEPSAREGRTNDVRDAAPARTSAGRPRLRSVAFPLPRDPRRCREQFRVRRDAVLPGPPTSRSTNRKSQAAAWLRSVRARPSARRALRRRRGRRAVRLGIGSGSVGPSTQFGEHHDPLRGHRRTKRSCGALVEHDHERRRVGPSPRSARPAGSAGAGDGLLEPESVDVDDDGPPDQLGPRRHDRSPQCGQRRRAERVVPDDVRSGLASGPAQH